jgi:hypothetical protein
MYVMVCTCPDLTFSIGVVSQYLSKPGLAHCSSGKRILRYLKGTSNLEIICLNEDLYLFFYQIKFKDIQMLTRVGMLIIKKGSKHV